MTLNEIAVVLFGLFAGYWVVSKLMFRSPKVPDQSSPPAPVSSQPRWNEILQIEPTASALEIRDAYRHLISKYHPDKVDSLGQELKDLADRKSQEITAAYRQGMQERGENP
jgi:DnaJ domain